MTQKHTVYLSLGSNMGDRGAMLAEAVRLIGVTAGTVVAQSSVMETEPWGFSSANKFLNLCLCIETTMCPHDLLLATQDIERQLGRTRKSVDGSYHDRPIDIDLLLYDDLAVNLPDLVIPHPHMFERDFVMRPLSEIISEEKLNGLVKRMDNPIDNR